MSGSDGEVAFFDNVGLRYGTGKEILTDISFSLWPGSFYFLTGASGAGKTSLLKLLYLAQRPSRGIIRMFGSDVITLPRARLPGFRRRLGVVFQDFRLVDHLSAFDNVALPLRIAGVDESELVIGRPDMLLADEPTGNVDPDMALKLMRLFESLNRLGTTVIVATHDVHLLQNVRSSTIMRLDKGRLADPTGALRYPPRSPAGAKAQR